MRRAHGKSPAATMDSGLLKEASTLGPIVHVLAACFFIYGYCSGFGNKIIAFVTISDVFIVSLRAVGQVYLYLGVPILVALIANSVRKRAWGRFFILAAAAVGTTAAILLVLSAPVSGLNNLDASEIAGISLIVAIVFGYLCWLLYREIRNEGIGGPSSLDVAVFIGLVFATSLALGHNKGVTDRHRTYDQARFYYFRCANMRLIIRPLGSHYLSLGPADQWGLVDEDCEVKFLVDARPSA